jgi:hypothetical protein
MRFGKGLQPLTAAVMYSWLLRAPGSPVGAWHGRWRARSGAGDGVGVDSGREATKVPDSPCSIGLGMGSSFSAASGSRRQHPVESAGSLAPRLRLLHPHPWPTPLCHACPQAHSILDGLTFSGFMQRVKDAACGAAPRSALALALEALPDDADGSGPTSSAPAPAPAAAADSVDDDTAACLGFEAVSNLVAMLGSVGLRSCDDVRQACAEALPELAAGARTGKATSATRAAGLTPGEL